MTKRRHHNALTPAQIERLQNAGVLGETRIISGDALAFAYAAGQNSHNKEFMGLVAEVTRLKSERDALAARLQRADELLRQALPIAEEFEDTHPGIYDDYLSEAIEAWLTIVAEEKGDD
jgi:Tfp pilus assembly protein PilN